MLVKEHVNYIIVGQGLAGSTLSLKLIEKGYSVKVIDNKHHSSSSLIAGGVTHPMSFKRIILSWRADELIPYAINYYHQLEKQFSEKLFYQHQMARVFSGLEEQNNWQGRMADLPLSDILYDFEEDLSAYPLDAPYGLGGIHLAGRLDVKKLLLLAKNRLMESDCYLEEQFNFDDLIVSENQVSYKNITADNIVFCEGFKFIENPYFSYLPSNLTKGEILVLKSKNIPEVIISKGCFVLPLGDDHFILGATYRWNNFNSDTSEEGKNELLEKIEQVGNFDFEIVEHRAGVRPTIPDRRPIIGRHPNYNNVVLFNGLGSKGVMIAPYYADVLVDQFLSGKEIPKEVNISRFSKKHLHKCSI